MDFPTELPDDGTPAGGGASPRGVLLLAWALLWLALALASGAHTDVGALPWLLHEAVAAALATGVLGWRLARLGAPGAPAPPPALWARRALAWLPLDTAVYLAAAALLRRAGHALAGGTAEALSWWPWLGGEALRFVLCAGAALAVLVALRAQAAQSRRRLQAEQAQARASQLQTLHLARQLDPGFLINALNSLSAAVHDDPDAADRLLGRLTALLRAVGDPSRWPEVPLSEELRLLEAYGELLGARHADRVTLGFEIDPFARDCLVPTMALQPLLAHAFHHGVERWNGHATIVVRARCEPGCLELAVDDNVGVLPQGLQEGDGSAIEALPADTRGGLEHLRDRLAALHGPQARLRLLPREGGGISARLSLPCASC